MRHRDTPRHICIRCTRETAGHSLGSAVCFTAGPAVSVLAPGSAAPCAAAAGSVTCSRSRKIEENMDCTAGRGGRGRKDGRISREQGGG